MYLTHNYIDGGFSLANFIHQVTTKPHSFDMTDDFIWCDGTFVKFDFRFLCQQANKDRSYSCSRRNQLKFVKCWFRDHGQSLPTESQMDEQYC